eukprot:2717086-Amphidinium_carterae.1
MNEQSLACIQCMTCSPRIQYAPPELARSLVASLYTTMLQIGASDTIALHASRFVVVSGGLPGKAQGEQMISNVTLGHSPLTLEPFFRLSGSSTNVRGVKGTWASDEVHQDDCCWQSTGGGGCASSCSEVRCSVLLHVLDWLLPPIARALSPKVHVSTAASYASRM